MKQTRRKTEGTAISLNDRIDRAVALQIQIEALSNDLKGEKAAIKEEMEDADLPRYATARGNEALRVPKESLAWNPDKLEKFLDDDEFDQYVPRKPDSTKLRKLLDTLDHDEAKDLLKCAKRSHSESLELRAKGSED
ncbi:MAG: hypothetical protein M5U26_08280 [Planctomycetota bacterium]|nr:hypothetical protein [Planctomycetota bacterium]